MPPLDEEQLAAEALELEAERQGPTGDADGKGPGPDAGSGDASSSEQQYIPNPAPKIAAGLKALRQNKLLARIVPPAALAVFDDATCEEIGGALGPLAMKYAPTIAPQLDALLARWGEEARALYVLGGVAWAVYVALAADPDAVRAASARDVSPGAAARGDTGRDPPPPGAGEPVAPGGAAA